MIQALKDRFGMTEAVNQTHDLLEEEYDNYPTGIEKIRREPNAYGEFVWVYLEEPFDWDIMRSVAGDMDLQPKTKDDDAHWFGFYETVEGADGNPIGTSLAARVRNDRPHLIRPEPVGEMEALWLEVLLRYLDKRYGEGGDDGDGDSDE